MPSEFRTLCCMAKVWRRDGTPLLKSSCSSYLCELMMLRAPVGGMAACEKASGRLLKAASIMMMTVSERTQVHHGGTEIKTLKHLRIDLLECFEVLIGI